MDPLDQRKTIEQLLEQERKWMDILRVVCVTPKNKDPVFAISVVWLIGNGCIPKMTDHQYHWGKLVLPVTWVKGHYYQATEYREVMGLTGYVLLVAKR